MMVSLVDIMISNREFLVRGWLCLGQRRLGLLLQLNFWLGHQQWSDINAQGVVSHLEPMCSHCSQYICGLPAATVILFTA